MVKLINRGTTALTDFVKSHSGKTIFFVLTLALILILFQPIRFFDGDEWTLFFVTRNFSRGIFSIDHAELVQQRAEAREISGLYGDSIGGLGLGSYRKRADGRYVLEKSPGYFIMLGICKRYHLERFLNIFLACGLLFLLGQLSALYFDKQQQTDIYWLLIFTPAALIMLYRPYMESFASYSLLGMGGACYLIADYASSQTSHRTKYITTMWIFSGLFFGLALFVRTALLPTVLLFVFHYIYRIYKAREQGLMKKEIFYGLLFFICIVLVGGVVFIYNAKVNGSPFMPGYALGKPKQSIYCFSFQRLFYPEPFQPFAIIIRNLIRMPELLVSAYPLLLIALPGIPLAYRHFRKDIFVLLFLWFASIYLLYLQFLVFNARHFMVIGRLYLPAVVPLAIFSSFTLAKLGGLSRIVALSSLVILGIISYLYFLCQIQIDPFGLGILDTFSLKNWISYK